MCPETEFVLCRCCFLIAAMEYIIVVLRCKSSCSYLLYSYLIHLCIVVIVGNIGLRISLKERNKQEKAYYCQ